MSKSLKLKNDTYIDSSSIVHNKIQLLSSLSFKTIDDFKNYVVNNLKSWNTYIFHLNISGNGSTAIVSKTTNLYSAVLVFGYGHLTLYSLINGVWSARNL